MDKTELGREHQGEGRTPGSQFNSPQVNCGQSHCKT
jgi:hypothetical protein